MTKLPEEALVHLDMPKSKYKVPINLKYETLNIKGVQKFLNKRTGELLDNVP